MLNTKKGNPSQRFVSLLAVNYGPDSITCSGIVYKKDSLKAFTIPDIKHHLCSKLPAKLNKGEEANFIFPYEEKMFLSQKPTGVGIRDSYGRIHWANKRSLQKSIKMFLEDFSPRDFPTNRN